MRILFFILLCTVLPADASDKIEDIVADYGRSIVFVAVQGDEGQKMGSGFVVDKDGLILTNYHIIHQAKKIFVKLKNKKAYQAALVAVDARHDIALLRIPRDDLKAVRLGSSRHLDAGERVITIGHPMGLENTVSDGLVSAVRKLDDGSKLVQISVPLSPGSSGGPLFDMHGKVVGITTSSFDTGQNLNFAVPIHYAKALMRSIEDRPAKTRFTSKQLAQAVSVAKARKLSMSDKQSATYTIQPKDTLYSLSRRFDTTVEELKALNNLSGSAIHTGQVLKVPRTP